MQWFYTDNWHYSYAGSPYARPESVEVLEGGAGADPAKIIAALRAKRNPWEIDPDLRSHDLDFLRGGIIVPEGVYRFTMEDNQSLPASFVDLDRDFTFVQIAYLVVQEPRAHFYGAREYGAWGWTPFPPYNDPAMGTVDVRHSTYLGEMVDTEDWEAAGRTVTVRLASMRLVGLFGRMAMYPKAAFPYDPTISGQVNPIVAIFPEQNLNVHYVIGMDFLAH